jgi:Na+-transporting NADH:ubiquinone oxidoreductase subunit NqrB
VILVSVNPYLLAALFPWLFWGLYVLVMGVYRAHLADRLSVSGYILGLPWVAAGYVVDAFANFTFAVILFADAPREWLVTGRLIRYVQNPDQYGIWRATIAQWICEHLLDVFDPSGDHC